MKARIPQWRYEEFCLARYLGIAPLAVEQMTCSDFADAWEFMEVQKHVDGEG